MKQFQLFGLLFFTAITFLLASCGGDDSKKETSTDTDTTTTTTAPATTQEVNTILTTPQNMMVATHKVSNYEKWLASYEEHDSLRLASGIHSYVIGRAVPDSNMVLVAVKVDDMEKAKAFGKSSHLKKAMQKGGVTGTPNISFMVATFQDTAILSTNLRARSSFVVKDWEGWQKGFKEGKQERLDNGIVERVYGHDPEDNKKVTLVTAITDTAKAFAYWKSDALKKRREASGVVSQPQRFVFRVVKRY